MVDLGETYSTADNCVYGAGIWLPGDGAAIADLPKVAVHHRRILDRSAVARVPGMHDR